MMSNSSARCQAIMYVVETREPCYTQSSAHLIIILPHFGCRRSALRESSISHACQSENHLNLLLYAPMALQLFSPFKSRAGCSHEDARLSTARITYRLLLLICLLLRSGGLHDALVSAL